jgi:hypothetical protein
MTPSRPEAVSDDGSKKDDPASSGGSSDTIRQVPPDSRPGYGNGALDYCLLLLITELQER